jgi:hypothetical protein
MSPSRQIECAQHGLQDETFVCQHVVQGLRDGKPYGFWWASDSDSPRPDAWCTACDELVAQNDGEWTGDAAASANIKLLCGACYDRARAMNVPGQGDRTG